MPHSIRPYIGREHLTVCDLSGRLDAASVIPLRQELDKLIAYSKVRLLVSLKSLEFVSAAGLDALLRYAQQGKSEKGDVKFYAANPNVRRVFELAGFTRLFQFLDTEEEAVKAFGDIGPRSTRR